MGFPFISCLGALLIDTFGQKNAGMQKFELMITVLALMSIVTHLKHLKHI